VSGIVATFARHGAPADRELLRAMTAAQRFRGPDAEATWQQGSVGLGHTLHHTEPSREHETQPRSLDGRLFITADARVDARQELCARLRDRGHDPRNDAPDSELLLRAYDAWGESFLEHILGDFSFALWDAPRRRLVCAVDQLGVKPFYYANRGELFVGSNSLQCVRLHPQVRGVLNEVAAGDFLLVGHYLEPDVTIYADIARVPPGHFLVVEASGLRVQRYFSLPQPVETCLPREDDYVEQFQELLGAAVRDRLRTSRVAVYLSGGVDSSLIAMTAKRQLERKGGDHAVEGFTCVFDWLIPDEERYYAGLVGQSLGIPIDFQACDDAQLFGGTRHFVPPEPADATYTQPLLEQAERLATGFSTVLTGWDGDALFLAATRLHWRERIQQRRFAALARELAWYIRHERGLPPVGVRTQLAHWRRSRRPLPQRPSWLREEFCERTQLLERWRPIFAPETPVRSREPSRRNFESRAWAGIFDSNDASWLGFPLEARHPLADLRVIRFAMGLPAVPFCVDKSLLRRCMHGLPEAVRTRPKTPLGGRPDQRSFRAHGLGSAARGWDEPQALEMFLDLGAVKRVLAEPSVSIDRLSPTLRAIALGLWVAVQPAPHVPVGHACPSVSIYATT
jgi:asparagine synthase (glutamine-hydrolysing)